MNIKEVGDIKNQVVKNFIENNYTAKINELLSELESKKNFIRLTIKNGTINMTNAKQMLDIISQINSLVMERDMISEIFNEV